MSFHRGSLDCLNSQRIPLDRQYGKYSVRSMNSLRIQFPRDTLADS